MEVSEEEATGAGRGDSHSPAPDGDNTTTEAVLDMIDEFVNGPAVVPRLPPAPDLPGSLGAPAELLTATSQLLESPVEPPDESGTSETSSIAPAPSEPLPDCPLAGPSRLDDAPSAGLPERPDSVDTAVIGNSAPSDSSNSAIETESENSVKVEECESSDRTLDNNTCSEREVTIGSAQSTSSDGQVAERRSSGDLSPSLIRRRLIRPPPNERRLEPTVTSTADSISSVSGSTDRVTCEVQKDVSSSSDAVSSNNQSLPDNVQTIPDYTKPTVCRAEPSSPPKKVKLFRNVSVKRASMSTASDKTSDNTSGVGFSGSDVDSCSFSQECDESNVQNREACRTRIPIPNENVVHENEAPCSSNNEESLDFIPLFSNREASKPLTNPDSGVSSTPTTLENSSSYSHCADGIQPMPEQIKSERIPHKVDECRIESVSSALQSSQQNCESVSEIVSVDKSLSDSEECPKLVPKLTLKLSNKLTEESKPSISKLIVKPIQPEESKCQPSSTRSQESLKWSEKQVPNITKLNIKPIQKPADMKSSSSEVSESESSENDDSPSTSNQQSAADQTNVEPVPKVTIKLSKQGNELDVTSHHEQIPKLTIKNIQRPEPNSEEEQIPKLTIKFPKDSEGEHSEKIPKLTIKTVLKPSSQPTSPKHSSKTMKQEMIASKSDCQTKLVIKISNPDKATFKQEGQPMSPKLLLKTTKSEGTVCEILENKIETPSIPKLTIKPLINPVDNSIENTEKSEVPIVPKITIKPIIKPDEPPVKPSKKLDATESESIPIVTKINIKPIQKPVDTEATVSSEGHKQKLPSVSKLNIKPLKRPEELSSSSVESENVIDSTVDDTPKITKLNIKPIKPPESGYCSPKSADSADNTNKSENIPVVTKLNIKPIKPPAVENIRETRSMTRSPDREKLPTKIGEKSSETGTIPIVTKLNIKPIAKPPELRNNFDHGQKVTDQIHNYSEVDERIPTVTKINIKPFGKPTETDHQNKEHDPRKKSENLLQNESDNTLLDSKPVNQSRSEQVLNCHIDEVRHNDTSVKVPILTKITIKPIAKPKEHEKSDESEGTSDDSTSDENIPAVSKLNIKPIVKPDSISEEVTKEVSSVPKLTIKPIIKSSEEALDTEKSDTLSQDNSTKTIEVQSVRKIPVNTKIPETDQSSQLQDHDVKNDISDPNTKDPKLITKLRIKPLIKPNEISETKTEEPNEINPEQKNNRKQLNAEKLTSNDLSIVPTDTKSVQEKTRLNCEITTVDKTIHTEVEEKTVKVKTKSINEINEHEVESEKVNNVQNDIYHTSNHLSENEDGSDNNISQSKVILKSVEKVVSNKVEASCNHTDSLNKDLEGSDQKTKSTQPGVLKRKVESQESPIPEKITRPKQESALLRELNKPLEVSTASSGSQSPGQGSPHIKIKINKTEQGPIAEIIAEEAPALMTPSQDVTLTDSPSSTNEIQKILKEHSEAQSIPGNKSKVESNLLTTGAPVGKRLRSSRLMNELQSDLKKTPAKRPSAKELALNRQKEAEAMLQNKRMKLDQLLSNSALTITPIPANKTSPSKTTAKHITAKNDTCFTVNNENCTKNGDSKLHSILTSLHAKCEERQILALEKNKLLLQDVDSNSTTGSDVVFIESVSQERVQIKSHEMIINETSNSQECNMSEEISQDPLDIASTVSSSEPGSLGGSVPATPQPKRRGRPRKNPTTDDVKRPEPVKEKDTPKLPTTALEERRQRSLRLAGRDRTPMTPKTRGRGRGRGRRTSTREPPREPETPPEPPKEEIDPTSSRIKLPRLTEALEKIPQSTPNSRLDSSDIEADCEATVGVPETPKRGKGLRGRGSRGGRYLKRVKGRGIIGGGRGATYMKETQGIYERVCGPTTSNVQLFEEETCMMDDNATSSSNKMSHLLDEDSQTSNHSITNDSVKNKLKFSQLFDSNKVWSAADVKEYTWPPPDQCTEDMEPRVMMIQEQVAMFLGVKGFKRRYPELKRRTVAGEERQHVLASGVATEELCDLGITAVDASDVLDIMLSDYPHKYEEFRSHQREREASAPPPPSAPAPPPPPPEEKEEKKEKEVKIEKEPAPEKSKQDMAAAAALSASEFNARLNAMRTRAVADMQSLCIQRRRPPVTRPAPTHVRPPGGYYPLALLPGQFAHTYNAYTPQQLRYLPVNTVLETPVWGDDESDRSEESAEEMTDDETSCDSTAQRKHVLKVRRVGGGEEAAGGGEEAGPRALCKLCNKPDTPDKPSDACLHCDKCKAIVHPSCLEFGSETTLRCRGYPWACAECKSCVTCARPADDDKMLFCDLCDRGHHIYCVGLTEVPNGRWHCSECAVCKSCGSRTPSGPPGAARPPGADPDVWHHQMKKNTVRQYSHTLCTPCARAYRIGRYCPLCDKSFIGAKGTVRLVICKLCDRQLHQDCVRATVAQLNILDYTCAECKRGGITSRAAAARLAPKTVATLFMAKRRFNKYAHRNHLRSLARNRTDNLDDSALHDDDSAPIEEVSLEEDSLAVPEEVTLEEAEEQDQMQEEEASDPLQDEANSAALGILGE